MVTTQSQLKEVLDYNPDTGIFKWLVKLNTRILIGQRAGNTSSCGYRKIKIGGKLYREHRLAFLFMTGSIPKCIDHINRIKVDNRWINLREATYSQNRANTQLYTNCKSGIKGVSFHDKSGKWRAGITVNAKRIDLGYHETKEEAASAYLKGAISFFGKFAPDIT